MSIAAVIATALVVVATLLIVATVIALWRAPAQTSWAPPRVSPLPCSSSRK